jgi:hypothetical protein
MEWQLILTYVTEKAADPALFLLATNRRDSHQHVRLYTVSSSTRGSSWLTRPVRIPG